MRKFLLKVFIFAAYAFLLQIVFPYSIDPFNVFHALNIRQTGIEPNQNYVKMKYVLSNPDKFDSFVFGSSRVGAIHVEKMPGSKTYNMTYSEGIPSEHLANIKTFLANNIRPRRIYVGLDGISNTVNADAHITEPLRCPYEYLCDDPSYFYSLYLNPLDTFKSLWVRRIKPVNFDKEIFYSFGWWSKYDRTSKYDWSKVVYKQENRAFDRKITENALQNIIDIKKLCMENDIELILFTNPMYCLTHMQAIDEDYLFFLEELVKISEFYNFSGLNDVTNNRENYLDSSHYNAYIGDMIINVICYGKTYPELYSQGFGVKVTRENISDLITLLRQQEEDFRQNKSPAN